MFWEYSKLITASIKIGGGLVLMIGAFSRNSSAARWTKRILFFAGLSALMSGIMEMIKIYYIASMTALQLKFLDYNKTLLGGLTLGFLLALLAAGELSLTKWKRTKIKNNKEEAKT